MESTAQESYLAAQVLTATPQKLRLMLIEGAIAAGRRTIELWKQSENDKAHDSLIRCRGMVSELLSAIRPDDSDVARNLIGVYTFMFQALTDAQLRRDVKRVEEAIRVLEVERGTWRTVCEQMPEAPAQLEPVESREILASDARQELDEVPGGALEFEA